MKLEIPYKQKTSSEKILENKKGRDGKKVKKRCDEYNNNDKIIMKSNNFILTLQQISSCVAQKSK